MNFLSKSLQKQLLTLLIDVKKNCIKSSLNGALTGWTKNYNIKNTKCYEMQIWYIWNESLKKFVLQLLSWKICIGNSMICSDIWHKYHEWYSKLLYVISRAVRRVKFETILKYHEWYLCQISCTNHAIICLYYYPQKFCNFHVKVFQIKLKYHCSEPIKLQKFLM